MRWGPLKQAKGLVSDENEAQAMCACLAGSVSLPVAFCTAVCSLGALGGTQNPPEAGLRVGPRCIAVVTVAGGWQERGSAEC